MAEHNVGQLNELLERSARGDAEAFQRFYDLTAPSILALLLRMMRDRCHAEDVLQDAMVTAWDKACEFDAGRSAATTWITMIARRRALDLLRSGVRRGEILREEGDDIRTALGLSSTGNDAPVESSHTAQRLTLCFDELQPDAATSIQLAYIDGFTFREISSQLEKSIGTVKSWVHRGLSKLKECMQR